jgi:hypothetical protein
MLTKNSGGVRYGSYKFRFHQSRFVEILLAGVSVHRNKKPQAALRFGVLEKNKLAGGGPLWINYMS